MDILDIVDIGGNVDIVVNFDIVKVWLNLYICTLEQFETVLGSVCSNLKNLTYLLN